MSQGSRRERVADLLRSELSELLTRTVKDPGLGFVTLTRVDLTADLQHARVYYTCIGNQEARQNSAKALERAAPFLRRQIGKRLHLKRIPELRFNFDESIGHHERIQELLEGLGLSAQANQATLNDDDAE